MDTATGDAQQVARECGCPVRGAAVTVRELWGAMKRVGHNQQVRHKSGFRGKMDRNAVQGI